MDPVVSDILAVAVAEFAEHGLAGARVDAIAARTATSKRMLYYHFGSKEGLYRAALEHAYAAVRAGPPPPDFDAMPPLEALAAWAGYVFDVHVLHPQFVRLVMGENLLGGRHVREAVGIRETNRQGLAVVDRIVERGRASGAMRPDAAAFDLYATTVAMSFHFVSNRPTFSAIFEEGADPDEVQRTRRRAVTETVLRYAGRCDHPVDVRDDVRHDTVGASPACRRMPSSTPLASARSAARQRARKPSQEDR